MKVIKIPASGPHSAFQQQISSENASNMPPGVKVVKLSAASSMVTNQRVAYTSQVTIRFYFSKQSAVMAYQIQTQSPEKVSHLEVKTITKHREM